MLFVFVQDSGADCPHDDTEYEETDCENGVIYRCFLGTSMATAEISEDYTEGHGKRDASNTQESDLRPRLLVRCPCREIASCVEVAGSVEDGKGGREHCEDYETAAEVDASESHLCHSDSSLDFLLGY